MLPTKRVFRHVMVLTVLLMLGVLGAQTAAAQQEQVFASTDGSISIHAPAGWVATNLPGGAIFSATLIVAQDQAVLETAARAFSSGLPMATAPGSYAVVNVVTPQTWTMLSGDPQQAMLAYLDAVSRDRTNPTTALTTNNVFQSTIGGANAIVYDVSTPPQLNQRGYLGGMVLGNTVALFQVVTSPISAFDSTSQLLQGIGSTIRIPAEPGAIAAPVAGASPTPPPVQNLPTLPAGGLPTQVAPVGLPTQAVPVNQPTLEAPVGQPTPVAAAPSPVAAVAMTLQRSAGDKLSLQLPTGWVFIDQSATRNAIAYGDSQAAAQSRFDTVIPPAAGTAPVPLTGSGGVVVLYPMSGFGVDPNAPDLKPLLDRLIGGLKGSGYQIIVEPRPMAVGPAQGIVAVVSGTEIGYLLLAPFGDQIAYITGTTTGSPDAFINDPTLQAQLGAIVVSVRVPAEQPTPEAPPLSGLGGLQPASTEPVTGGLGGLGVAPAATTAP